MHTDSADTCAYVCSVLGVGELLFRLRLSLPAPHNDMAVNLNLCAAHRSVLQDGMKFLVPTAHSVLLCFMFGPLGVLSHLLTKALMGKRRRNTVMLATSSFSDDHM